MKSLLMIMLVVCTCAYAADDILIAGFDAPDYGAWEVTGYAFGPGPAHGTLPNQMAVSGFKGKGLVNSYFNGDGATGTLASPEFKIERKFINFLLGGGAHVGQTCINLLVEGKVVRTATGPNSERLDWYTWDVGEFAGKPARIAIIDKAKGGWGHINVDQIVESDERRQEEVMTSELYNETYRPQFHFTAKKGWINDPNGLVFYKGEYHLFFQHNPFGTEWGNMHWGHAVSTDLVHWEELPIALAPDEHGTCFSGSAVIDWNNTAGFQTGGEKVIVCIYTGAPVPEVAGGPKFTQCIAYSNDCGRTWTKYDKNPVLPHIIGANRDPKVAWHQPSGKWVMALFKDGNDFAFFSSPNLKEWTHLSDINVPGSGECPDWFELAVDGNKDNKKWAFLGGDGDYLIGSFDGKSFTKESGKFVDDYGAHTYATQTYNDIPESDGRRVQLTWMNGGAYPQMPFNQQMTFPCELTLRTFPEGIRLCKNPVKEIESLYDKEFKLDQVANAPGDLFDITGVWEIGDAAKFGIKARGEAIEYDVKEKKVSCLGRSGPLEPVNNQVKLRILVDRTSIEVYCNDGQVVLSSCFVPRAKSKGIEAFCEGGEAKIVSLEAHTLKSIWK